MELLYSNILPAAVEDGQETIIDRFNEEIAGCDGIDIAVGYVSRAALEELNKIHAVRRSTDQRPSSGPVKLVLRLKNR